MYTIIPSTNTDTLTSSFPIYITFISFCLTALARTSSTILNRCGESRQYCLVPDFSGNASCISPFSLIMDDGLRYIDFIMF